MSAAPSAAELRLANALWATAHFTADPRVRIYRPAPDYKSKPFAVRRFDLGGEGYELACWLPGPHPRHARWCEELSVWLMLRKVP